jgi:hypothetical protein
MLNILDVELLIFSRRWNMKYQPVPSDIKSVPSERKQSQMDVNTLGKSASGSILLTRLYTVIVANLVLWLAVLASAYYGFGDIRVIALTGFIFAALSQHWAYYALRKADRAARA